MKSVRAHTRCRSRFHVTTRSAVGARPQRAGHPQHEARDDSHGFADEVERESKCAAQGDEMTGSADRVARERQRNRHRQEGDSEGSEKEIEWDRDGAAAPTRPDAFLDRQRFAHSCTLLGSSNEDARPASRVHMCHNRAQLRGRSVVKGSK